MPSKVLAASDSGIIKFLSYDGELRYKSILTIKGLTQVYMLTDQLVLVETYTDLLLYRTSEFLKDADQIEPALTIRSNVAAKN